MEYHRQTVDSDMLNGIFNLPQSLRNKKVEVIILPVENERVLTPKSSSAFGCLKKYANPALMQQEKGAWEQAMVEKYANR